MKSKSKVAGISIKRSSTLFYAAIGLLVLTSVLIVFFVFGVLWHRQFDAAEEAAQYGDSFGFANALFSALALSGVILALFVQIKEMRITWDEINESRIAQQSIARQAFSSSAIGVMTTIDTIESRFSFDKDKAKKHPNFLAAIIKQTVRNYALHGILRKMVNDNEDAPDELRVYAELNHGEGLAHHIGAIMLLAGIVEDCQYALSGNRDELKLEPTSPAAFNVYASLQISVRVFLNAFKDEDEPIQGFEKGEPGSERSFRLSSELKRLFKDFMEIEAVEIKTISDEANRIAARKIHNLLPAIIDFSIAYIFDSLGYYSDQP